MSHLRVFVGLKSGSGIARPGCLRVSDYTEVMPSARDATPSDSSNGDLLPNSLTWLLARFSSSKNARVSGSIPQCLLTRGLPQFLAMGALHVGAFNTAPGFHQRERTRDRSHNPL